MGATRLTVQGDLVHFTGQFVAERAGIEVHLLHGEQVDLKKRLGVDNVWGAWSPHVERQTGFCQVVTFTSKVHMYEAHVPF